VTDTTIIPLSVTTICAIIFGIAGVPASISATLSLFNRFVLAAVNKDVTDVKTNVNGNITELRNELTILTLQFQKLTEAYNLARGVAEERERGRLAGDLKYAEGVESERERNRLRAEVPK
jgi:hypothetical protein